ncbi:MAG: DUF4112 domain-containing protein [Phycisphaerales bacterium]
MRSTLKRADALASLLDTRFRLPGTSIRFGLDPIISIIPVAGDTISAVISTYIVREAIRHRLGWRIVLRMIINIIINWLVGVIPVVGVIPDTLFKSNSRNARLLRDGLHRRFDPQIIKSEGS